MTDFWPQMANIGLKITDFRLTTTDFTVRISFKMTYFGLKTPIFDWKLPNQTEYDKFQNLDA